MREALELVQKKLVNVIAELAKFADKIQGSAYLGLTHFQPAQPTTVGKRATLWAQEFIMDLEDLEYVKDSLKLLGSKVLPVLRPASWSCLMAIRKPLIRLIHLLLRKWASRSAMLFPVRPIPER